MHLNTSRILAQLSAVSLVFAALPAQAYTGPGLGLGALGVAFGILASIVLAIASVLWYPFKRMIRRLRNAPPRVD